MSDSPTIGHNRGPLNLADALEPDQLNADLLGETQHLRARCAELKSAFERFDAATPNGIHDEETQAKAGDFVRQIGALVTSSEGMRTDIKRPVLDAQRLIDGHFKREITDPMDSIKRAVLAKIMAYLQRKDAEERERLRVEAERHRAEAARLAAEAERRDSAALMARAVEAEEQAAATERAPAARQQTRSDMGTVVSSRKGPWKVRVTDITKVPAAYLLPNEPVLLAIAKTSAATIEGGTQPVPGVEFYRETLANVR